MSDYMAAGEVLGYTPAEERCIERRIRELMDQPDMDGVMKYCDCADLVYLLLKGRSDEARDMIWKAGRKWAEAIAMEELQ